MNESESNSAPGKLSQTQWDEVAKAVGPLLLEAGPGWLGCLGFCYDIEITFKEAKARIVSVDPKPPFGLQTVVDKAIEAAIQSLAKLKFPSKHWQHECANDDCDCWLLVGPGETDFKVPTVKKKKTFTVSLPRPIGNLAFSVEFELTITIHIKGEFGVCTDGII